MRPTLLSTSRSRHRWENNIRVAVKQSERVWAGFSLGQDRDQWQTFVNMLMTVLLPQKVGNCLSQCLISFSERTLLHGDSYKMIWSHFSMNKDWIAKQEDLFQDGNNRLGRLLYREKEKEHGWKLMSSDGKTWIGGKAWFLAGWLICSGNVEVKRRLKTWPEAADSFTWIFIHLTI